MELNEELLNIIWEKGTIVEGIDPELFRKDACGAWISKDLYNEKLLYGWSVNLTCPKILGGDNRIENLRPMQYYNNISKENDYPSYMASVTSDGYKNIKKSFQSIVNKDIQKQLKEIYDI